MATLYWTGGSHTYDGVTLCFATSSGGAASVAAPTSSDDVVWDSLSNATGYTVTISATLTCRDFTMGAPASGVVTWAGASAINCWGNVNLAGGAAGITVTYTGILSMVATSGTKTFTSNGTPIQPPTFNGVGGTFQLADNMVIIGATRILTLVGGTFDANGKDVTITSSTVTISGGFTFYNFIFQPVTPAKTHTFILASNIVVTGTLTTNIGATVTNRVLLQSNTVGTARTITAAAVSISNCDLQDITGAGAASWDLSAATGGSGNCGGNSLKALGDAAFTPATTQHWINTLGGSWSTAANWTSRVPLPQDSVVMDCAFGTSKTVTADMPRLGASIDWTGATWTTGLTWAMPTSASLYGSLTMISGLTMSGTSAYTFAGRGAYTFDSKGLTFGQTINITAPTGTLTLLSDLSVSSLRSLNTGPGTLSCVNGGNNYAISTGSLGVQATGTLTLGSATHLITGDGTSTIYGSNILFICVGTLSSHTSTLKFTSTASLPFQFAGSGKTYYNVWFARGASTGTITITGSNTFTELKDTGTAAHSILFTAGTTQTSAAYTFSGTAVNLLPANQSNVETDITGFTAWNAAVLTRDTGTFYSGAASLKTATPGIVSAEGFGATYTTSAQGTYTGQVRVTGTGTVFAFTRITYNDTSNTTGAFTYVTLDGSWRLITPASVTSNPDKTVTKIELFVRTNGAQVATYYADALQIELGGVASGWVTGGTGGVITLDSTSTATFALIKTGYGPVSEDYLNIQHCVASGAPFFAGTHSTDNQGVATPGSGWTFRAPPVPVSGTLGASPYRRNVAVGGKPYTTWRISPLRTWSYPRIPGLT